MGAFLHLAPPYLQQGCVRTERMACSVRQASQQENKLMTLWEKLRVNREARIVLIHAWYMREKRRARCRAWKKANPEKSRASARNWRKVNPEKSRASVRNWQKANPEKAKALTRAWIKANPEKNKSRVAAANLKKQPRFKHTPLELRKAIIAAKKFAKEINDVKINRKSSKGC
jgi:hypothetical protein